MGGGDARVIRLAVRVDREHADLVLAELTEVRAGSLEERDVDERTIEYTSVRRARRAARAARRARRRRARSSTCRRRAGGRLEDRWRSVAPGMVGVEGGGRAVRVRAAVGGRAAGTIDDAVREPAQAFGAGTARRPGAASALLLELDPGGALADWGGRLAVAAAKLGFAPVLACDVEAASVRPPRTRGGDGVAVEVTRARPAARARPVRARPSAQTSIRPLLLQVAENLDPDTGEARGLGLLRHKAHFAQNAPRPA